MTKKIIKTMPPVTKAVYQTLILLLLCSYAYSGEPASLTILHTNDIHGQFLPLKATWLEDQPEIGGFEALSYYVEREREQASNSLLLDAGDLMTGSMICEIEHKGAYGGALVDMMNHIGFDAMVPGNHEFDISVTNLRALESIANFPILCANMSKGNGQLTEEAYHIYEVGPVRVGVIGLTCYPMRGMVSDPNLEGFDSTEPELIIDSLIISIDPLTDVIIILSHMGIEYDRRMAERTKGLDLIVGGHSHAELFEPERVNGVLIVQAGSKSRYLGRIDLTIEGDSVAAYDAELIPMFTEIIQPDPEISAMVSQFRNKIDKRYGRVIGKTEKRWENSTGKETELGRWLTDVLNRRLYTDIAVINSGAIRKELGPGEITIADIEEMLPFNNQIVTFGCTGRQLQSIAEQNISAGAEGYIYPMYISGMTCLWRQEDSTREIAKLLINGEPIDSNRIYQVASIDYMVIYNSERYFGYKIKAYIKTNYSLPDLIIDDIEKHGIPEGKPGARFKKLN
jgi:5'-nucleotidase/UDP-sugar diphosphatase